jgi:uncharacterized protein HemX
LEERMETKDRPGYRTTEFWLSTLAAIVGVILASGLVETSPIMKVAGMAAAVLSAMGYSVSRGMTKRAIVLLVAIVLPLGIGGCGGGQIRAEAVDGLVRQVSDRHDKLVKGELKASEISEADRATYLRSTELLRKVLDEARK